VAVEWMLYRLLHCTHWLVQPRIDEEEGQLCWLSAAMLCNGAPSPSNLWLQLCSTCSMVGVPALSAENSVS